MRPLRQLQEFPEPVFVASGFAAAVAGMGGVGVGTISGRVMNGSRVALGAARDTSQRIPSTSAAPAPTSVAPTNSRRVL